MRRCEQAGIDPARTVVAHSILHEDGMTDRQDRIELLESIKNHPEETPR